MRVSNLAARSAVPWQFRSMPDGLVQYTWRARESVPPRAQFVATIIREGGLWSWQVVADRLPEPLRLGQGEGDGFDECQAMVLETVGKSFPSSVGHEGLATAASYIYVLADGERVDLAELNGAEVTLVTSSGEHVEGVLVLGGWMLRVIAGDGEVVVHPATVDRVVPQAGERRAV